MIKNFYYIFQLFIKIFFGIRFFETRISNNKTTLHIFGSGNSSILTKQIINNNDHSFACNLSIRFKKKWNYVFIENIGNSSYGKQQLNYLKKITAEKIILKNLYYFNFNIKNIAKLRKKGNLFILREYQSSYKSILGNVEQFNKKTIMIPQYASTILTMLLISFKEGYRNVVIHGVDFVNNDGSPHQTENFEIPFSYILDKTISILESKGMNIRYAIEILNEK